MISLTVVDNGEDSEEKYDEMEMRNGRIVRRRRRGIITMLKMHRGQREV
jgi:hypothetical protein